MWSGRPGADGGDDSDANGDEDPDLVAHAAVTARQIQERAQAGDVPVYDAEERIQFLSDLMGIIQTHVDGVLTIVLDKVPEQAKGAIERAMEQARIGFEHAKAAIQQGQPEDNGKPEWADPPGGESEDDEEPEDEE